MKKYIVMFILGVIVFGTFSYMIKNSSKETIVATVTDKDRITESNGDHTSSKYLIFTDVETFENTDELMFGKMNSSDVYGQLSVNKTYEFTVVGYRIPWFSSYRNIIKHKLIKTEDPEGTMVDKLSGQ